MSYTYTVDTHTSSSQNFAKISLIHQKQKQFSRKKTFEVDNLRPNTRPRATPAITATTTMTQTQAHPKMAPFPIPPIGPGDPFGYP